MTDIRDTRIVISFRCQNWNCGTNWLVEIEAENPADDPKQSRCPRCGTLHKINGGSTLRIRAGAEH